jgi:lactate dehydrogenase-like 2-hydroxyacid dehydrogenase
MKDGVTIINTSRGGIINTEDLISAMKSGKISHSFLDVLEHEKNIIKNKELTNLPGVIVTPHIAFYADDTMKKMYSELFSSIRKYFNKGKLLHKVKGI